MLGILDKFQEGRSHMAIVSRISVEKAASVKKVAKRTLTQRLRQSVGISDSSDSSESSDDEDSHSWPKASAKDLKKNLKGVSWSDDPEKSTIHSDVATEVIDAEKQVRRVYPPVKNRSKQRRQRQEMDLEAGQAEGTEKGDVTKDKQKLRLPKAGTGLEQNMPADALLTKKDAKDFLQGIDPAIMPLGIITLEDVLEGGV